MSLLAGPRRGKLLQGGKVDRASVHRLQAHLSQYYLESHSYKNSPEELQNVPRTGPNLEYSRKYPDG